MKSRKLQHGRRLTMFLLAAVALATGSLWMLATKDVPPPTARVEKALDAQKLLNP